MKTPLLVIALVAALGAGGAQAQEKPGRHGPAHPPGPPVDRLAEALRLTDAQKAAWKELHEGQREATKATLEEGRALHEALRVALEADRPDPLEVGQAMIALEAHRKKMAAAHETLEAKLVKLLDAEQKVRFETLRSLRQGPEGGPGGPRFGPPPPGMPPPDGTLPPPPERPE